MNEESIFFKAIECPTPEGRSNFLDQVCADDAELRERIECLLQIHESIDDDAILFPAQQAAEEASWELAGFSLDFLKPSERAASLGLLDDYDVLQIVGVGGTSLVLEAFDTKLERIVAIKVLSAELCRNAQSRERFHCEARAAAAVSHRNVTRILGVGEQNLTPYLVMEFVQGQSLQQRIREEGALPVPEICRIGMQIAEGLSAIHDEGLVHRDIKPGNIILSAEEVKITDFGLTRAIDHLGLTRTGEVPGTPEYMSPEQAQSLPIDQVSDLFSLGSVLYTMATGESPFQAATPLAAMKSVCDDVPKPIRKLNSRIPRWLREVINELLQKDPQLRIPSAAQLADLLTAHARPRIGWKRRVRQFPRQILWISAVVAVACLPLIWVVLRDIPGHGLLKQFARRMGKISVIVDDPSVEVQISDGKYYLRRVGTIKYAPIGPFPHRVIAQKDGTVIFNQTVDIPKWGNVEIEIDSQELLAQLRSQRPASSEPPQLEFDSPDQDPDREAAESVLQSIGSVQILCEGESAAREVRTLDALPDGSFHLEGVELAGWTSEDLARICPLLSQCPSVRTLWINDSELNGETLILISRIDQLLELQLTGVRNATPEQIATLSRLQRLARIRFVQTSYVEEFLEVVQTLPNLHELDVVGPTLRNHKLQILNGNSIIQRLSLCSPHLTSGVIDHIRTLPSLDYLSINSRALEEDEFWGRIATVSQISSLSVDCEALSLRRIDSLREMPRLQSLKLTNATLDDDSVSALRGLRQLRELSIVHGKPQNADLRLLKSLDGLKELHLFGTSVPPDHFEQLRATLPACRIAGSVINGIVRQ